MVIVALIWAVLVGSVGWTVESHVMKVVQEGQHWGNGATWKVKAADFGTSCPFEVVDKGEEKGSVGGNGPLPFNNNTSGGNGTKEYMETVLFQVAAIGLPSMDAFGNDPDPYVLISANGTSGKYEHVKRLGTLKNTHEAVWTDTVRFQEYRRGSNQHWQFEIWDYDSVGRDDLIGYAWISIDACVCQSRRTPTEQPACSTRISGDNGLLHVTIV